MLILFSTGASAYLDFGAGYDSNVFDHALSEGDIFVLTDFSFAQFDQNYNLFGFGLNAEKYFSQVGADVAQGYLIRRIPLGPAGMHAAGLAELIWQPNNKIYNNLLFAGSFSYSKDLNERSTAAIDYFLRYSIYPDYNNDYVSNQIKGSFDFDWNNSRLSQLAVYYEVFNFSEQNIYDGAGFLTDQARVDQVIAADLNFKNRDFKMMLNYLVNDSNANYYLPDPYVPVSLPGEYYNYTDRGIKVEFSPAHQIFGLEYSRRDYFDRPAKNSSGQALNQVIAVNKLTLGYIVSFNLAGNRKLIFDSSFVNSSSNDYLSDYSDFVLKLILRLI